MFRLQRHDEPIKWPVKISVPQPGGAIKKHTFNAHYLYLDQDAADAAVAAGDEEFLLKVIQGWDGIQDEDGNELPHTEDNVRRISKIPYIKSALISHYFEMLAGIGRKN